MNTTISYMRALAIICMVGGHAYTHSFLESFVSLFHMPLFFFVSGYCFKEKYLLSTKQFISRKIKGIWLPTIKWFLPVILMHNLLLEIGVYNIDYPFSDGPTTFYSYFVFFQKIAAAILFLNVNERVFAGMWFLKCLLLSSLCGYLIIKESKSKHKLFVMLCVLLFLTVLLCLYKDSLPVIGRPYLPVLSTFFFICGFVLKKYYSQYEIKISSIYMCLLYLGVLICAYLYWPSAMGRVSSKIVVPYSITALLGIFLIMAISRNMNNYRNSAILKYLAYLGNNTYVILMMHVMCFKLVTLAIIYIYDESMNELACFPTFYDYTEKGWWIVYLIIGVNMPLLFQFIYDKTIKKQ